MKPEPLTGQRTLERHFRPHHSCLCSLPLHLSLSLFLPLFLSLSLGWSSTAHLPVRIESRSWTLGGARMGRDEGTSNEKSFNIQNGNLRNKWQVRQLPRKKKQKQRHKKKKKHRELYATMFKQFQLSLLKIFLFSRKSFLHSPQKFYEICFHFGFHNFPIPFSMPYANR